MSFERTPNDAIGPTVSWLTTCLTFSTPWAMAVACDLASSVGTSPVSSRWPPYAMALTRAASPSLSEICFWALKAMFWSSSWIPEVRRSVTTTAVVAAAPPTIRGAQADSDSAAPDRAAASSRGGRRFWRLKSFGVSKQKSVNAVAKRMQQQYMDFLDAHGAIAGNT